MNGLYWSAGFSLIPSLATLHVPTLVLHGDDDFVPVECAAHIAEAIPGAKLRVLEHCGLERVPAHLGRRTATAAKLTEVPHAV